MDSLPKGGNDDFASNIAGKAKPSRDVGLTAFAQLTALRLNAQRCLISLFDAQYQYIIAEATRTLPLHPDSTSERKPGDELWLSSTAIPRNAGCCEHLLKPMHDGVRMNQVGNDTIHVLPGAIGQKCISVIPDLAEDGRFRGRLCVDAYPRNRFYAGCPIRTSRGVDIGVICVFDPTPRPEGIDAAQKEFMVDISTAIMRHLESNRLRQESRRNERMVRGIGSFVEGSSTLAGWWSNNDTSSYDAHADGEGILDVTQQDLAKQATINPVSGREASASDPQRNDPKIPRVKQEQNASERPANAQGLAASTVHDYAVHDHVEHKASEHRTGQPVPNHAFKSALTPHDVHRRAIQTTFAKASNIIRESLEVEGVVFLDARISSFGGMVKSEKTDSTSGLSDVSDVSTSSTTVSQAKSEGQESPAETKRVNDPLCNLLAYATSDNSTINSSSQGGRYEINESALKKFIRRYPSGTVFNFDELGILQSSDSEASIAAVVAPTPESQGSKSMLVPGKKTKGKRTSKINDGVAILKLLPGARTAAFFPLWDHDRQRWFAGAIAWSSQARPFSTRGELSYLAAFGNTVMSQVARLDARVVDKAKTDLLGSISHELRSPLHGILGGVEMLADTDIDPFQNDVLHTIETCGKTLLDTMDHLLDFAQINNLSHDATQKSKTDNKTDGRRRTKHVGHDSLSSDTGVQRLYADVELDTLVEEVVESVYAGQQFFSKTAYDSPPGPPSSSFAIKSASPAVAVILDLDYADKSGLLDNPAQTKDWTFNLVPGGFRRILMNIFANALKYTAHGSIRVSLSAAPARNVSHTDDRPTSSSSKLCVQKHTVQEVTIKVTDSGRGISSDFLDNRMFLPFTQEDRLNPGTGLGLSIAHQLVSQLDGTISARSTVGIGTEFTVTLPLEQPKKSRSRQTSDSLGATQKHDLMDHIKAAKGLRIALVGFAEEEIADAKDHGTRTPGESTAWTLPRAEIGNICRSKLGMEVLIVPADATQLFSMVPRPELLLTTSQHFKQLLQVLTRHQGLGQDHVIPPIVSVCPTMAVAKARTQAGNTKGVVVDFISQPCGPRKLANAFALSMVRWSEDREKHSEGMLTPFEEPMSPYFEHASMAARKSADTHVPLMDERGEFPIFDKRSNPHEASPSLKRNSFLLVEDNPINMRVCNLYPDDPHWFGEVATDPLLRSLFPS